MISVVRNRRIKKVRFCLSRALQLGRKDKRVCENVNTMRCSVYCHTNNGTCRRSVCECGMELGSKAKKSFIM